MRLSYLCLLLFIHSTIAVDEYTAVFSATDSIFESSYNVTSPSTQAYSVTSACFGANGNFIVGTDTITAGTQTISSYNGWAAVRFSGITIPFNATITSAALNFSSIISGGGLISFSVSGEKAGNAPALQSSSFCVSTLPLTDASVPFTLDLSSYAGSPLSDLTPILQEIVGLSSWRKNNSIVLIVSVSSVQDGQTEISARAPQLSLDVTYTVDECAGANCTAPFFCNDTNTSGMFEWRCVYNLCVVNTSSCPARYACLDPNPLETNFDLKTVVCTYDECTVGNGGCPSNTFCFDSDDHNQGGVQCNVSFNPFSSPVTIYNGTIALYIPRQANTTNSSVNYPAYVTSSWNVWQWSANDQKTLSVPGYTPSTSFPQKTYQFSVGPQDSSSNENTLLNLGNVAAAAPLIIVIDLSKLTPPVSLYYLQNGNFIDPSGLIAVNMSNQYMYINTTGIPTNSTFLLTSQTTTSTPFLNTTYFLNCNSKDYGFFNNNFQSSVTSKWFCASSSTVFCFPAQNFPSTFTLQRVMAGSPGSNTPYPSAMTNYYNCTLTLRDFSGTRIQQFVTINSTITQYYLARGASTVQSNFVSTMNTNAAVNLYNNFSLYEQVSFAPPS
ncbi:calcium-binding RTX family protein [Planoprotostelium fungivorum]|uniref:Calcium-binding RTX family protein n=1 Tax=Planoprotostelium fungivorum TaxID=1890364 RepID=A0A2P6MYB7_9EUKA|nr:calcium-binding RTX family protein [Planoprotostelium fungivorum]